MVDWLHIYEYHMSPLENQLVEPLFRFWAAASPNNFLAANTIWACTGPKASVSALMTALDNISYIPGNMPVI